jgi:hypothetical protein
MFTDSTCPYIQETATFTPDVLVLAFQPPSVWRRVITTNTFRRTWLTKAAADSMAGTYQSNDSSGMTTATVKRMSDVGAFEVDVTVTTESAFVEDT